MPVDIGDGWRVASLSDQGFDPQLIQNMMDRVVSGRFPGIDSVTIVRNDALLLYWFAT